MNRTGFVEGKGKKRGDNINLFISLYIVDHYLNIAYWSIVVCQIHIENRESDVWFG